MAKAGKRMSAATAAYDNAAAHSVADAVKIVKGNAKVKFDETVELAINLGVDPRHADQMVRGVCNLPNGTGLLLSLFKTATLILTALSQRRT